MKAIPAILIFILTHFSFISMSQVSFDIESGIIPGLFYNETRIPGDNGTTFDFEDNFERNVIIFFRIRGGYTLANRHNISVLYAPLTINYRNGEFENTVFFEGENFQSDLPLSGRYKFNSYRLTYRYKFVDNARFQFWAGLTGKIRDAAIRLANEATASEKTDFGFVPLINFYTLWQFNPNFSLIFEGDALVGPQGRAADLFLGIGGNLISNHLLAKAGYRVLEGGADNDEVYNFTWINYLSAGLIIFF